MIYQIRNMKYKHNDIAINPERPFANCQLDREQYANVLTQIVSHYADGFVLSVNGQWGTGKSTFMKMWNASLKLDGYQTVYFNAWENDFTPDPFVAILGEIQGLISRENGSAFDKVLEIGGRIAHNTIPTLMKVAVKKLLGEDVGEITEAITKEAGDIFKEKVLEYQNKKEQFQEFRKELSNFINSNIEKKPLVFIVDELDRCRPDYAVEVLESIKHLFSIEGIVFVLAIDKEQLCNAIRGRYGSDRINAEEYLRRFIDVEYLLPEPQINLYCNYLYKYFDFASFLECDHRSNHDNLCRDGEIFKEYAIEFATALRLTLRQIEKLFIHMRLVLRSLGPNRYLFPRSTFTLIYIRANESQLYHKITQNKLSLQELMDALRQIFPESMLQQSAYSFGPSKGMLAMAEFVYNYTKGVIPNINIMEQTMTNNETKYNLKFEAAWLDKKSFIQAYERYQSMYHGDNWGFVVGSIDLLNNTIDS